MRLLGFTITRTKQAPPGLSTVAPRSGGWSWPLVREPFPGAWQRNQEQIATDPMQFPPAWACATLIASDISKLWLRLVELQDGIWVETENPAYSPVLRKPNRYQNRIKFVWCWMLSKLLHGNTYVLKQRDQRGVVIAMYILDPTRVKVLVSPDGSVFYQVTRDNLSGLDGDTILPAAEIIHDLEVPLYHPLVGVAPVYAAALAARQGLRMQEDSEQFFANNSQPGGVILVPTAISDDDARILEQNWEAGHALANRGRVAALTGGATYQPIAPMSPHDAQLTEQFNLTAQMVCSCFHVPPYMIGVGPMPNYNNIQALNLQYYSQALQERIESFELCLDEGLEIRKGLGVELDKSALLHMDSVTQMDMAVKGVGAAIFTPNEAREIFNYPAKTGGEALYLQQQNYSLNALAKRDASADPFGTAKPEPVPAAVLETGDDEEDDLAVGDGEKFAAYLRKELAA